MQVADHLIPRNGQAVALRERRSRVRAKLEDQFSAGEPMPPMGPQQMDLHDILINRLVEVQLLTDQLEQRAKGLSGIPGCHRTAARDVTECRGLYAAVSTALLALDGSREFLRMQGHHLGMPDPIWDRQSYANEDPESGYGQKEL